MRRSLLVFLLFTVVVLTLLLHSVSTLLSLLIEDASRDAIHRSELPAPNSTLLETRPQLIPKIIHQTYINESIPAHWVPAQQSCINLHPDYEYILWTDQKSLDFITQEYPWFLSTFIGYKHPIQRADAIRYFVLAHYGGVYIDLDDGCKRRLDPLLSYNAFVRRTVPHGNIKRRYGRHPSTPVFPARNGIPTGRKPILVPTLHHHHGLHGPPLPQRHVEEVDGRARTSGSGYLDWPRPSPHARGIQPAHLVFLRDVQGLVMAWQGRTADILDGQELDDPGRGGDVDRADHGIPVLVHLFDAVDLECGEKEGQGQS